MSEVEFAVVQEQLSHLIARREAEGWELALSQPTWSAYSEPRFSISFKAPNGRHGTERFEAEYGMANTVDSFLDSLVA